ncbi:hypothetical protein D3C71_1479430 [compost metagenome]
MILLAAGSGVFAQRLAEGVLHPLRWLCEIGVHVAAFKELNQLRQSGCILSVFFVDVLTYLGHRRHRRDFFEGVVMFCGVGKGGSRIFQQIGFGTALLIIRVHHHASGGTTQVDTRLQHQVPGRCQLTLLES